MLSPRYLDGLSDEITEIYSQLETDILCDMARRIARLGKITEMTEYQARTLVEAGLLKQNIARVLKNYDRRILEELTAIFSEAMIKSIRADNRIFKEDMGRTLSDSQTQVMLASIKKVHSDLSRLTLTTAETGNYQFIRIANRAYMNVASGAFNFHSAIKQAADELAKEGLHTRVTYSNKGKKPVTRSIEAAVRMNVLTGVNQTATAVSLTNCDELECDLVEVTAHTGSRPSHEAWQGKIYSISGKSNKYPPFSVCGYGEADGICGVNCRHSFYPYFEGQEKHYTQDDLDELSTESVTYNGKEMTRYEGEQQLRHIERNIRFYKKKAAIENAANLDNSKSRLKIGEWQARARDFTKQTGIMRDAPRERIGMKDGAKQPRGILTSKTLQTPKSAQVPTPTTTPTITPSIATAQATKEKLKTLVDNPKSQARKYAELLNIESRPVFAFAKQPTEADIIARLVSGDKTGGSCSSVANAYIANKGGFDVLDFRGGKSLDLFADRNTSLEMVKFNGVKSFTVAETDQIKAGYELLNHMEVGKEYKLGVGRHAAIVRKLKDGTRQFLEMQSSTVSGWTNFDENTFKDRFGCKICRTYYQTAYLIELESLSKSREFIELMQYLNTAESAQIKGIGGGIK